MAERSRSLPLTLPAPRSRVHLQALAIVREWFGIPLAAVCGLLSALYYVESPAILRPIFDDSFISLTFARNLAQHAKLSFDGQYWSGGATSPLHVAVLALPIKLGADPIRTGLFTGVAAHALLAVATYLLAWAIFRNRLAALLASLAIAFTPLAAVDAGNGLETSLFLFLVTLTMASFFFARSDRGLALTGVLIALALLARPEAAFLVPAALVYRWLERERHEPLRDYLRGAVLLAAPAAFVFAGLAAYSLHVNGTLGGTATAKMRFFQESRQPLWERLHIASDHFGLFAGEIITLLGLAAITARRKEVLLFALFWLPVMVLYAVLFPGGLLHYFYRYQHPVLPLVAVLAGGGAAYLIAVAAAKGFAVKALAVAVLVVAIFPIWKQYERWHDIYRQSATELHLNLETMAIELNQIVKPDEVLATHDIGAVGYYADYAVLDLVGLVNSRVLPYHERRQVKEYIEAARPDYLLIFPEWDPLFLLIFPGAQPERYELVKVYPGGDVRLSPYLLYRISYP